MSIDRFLAALSDILSRECGVDVKVRLQSEV